MPININYGADVGLLAKLAMSVGAGNGRQQSQADVLRFMANRDNNATRARVAAMGAGGGRGRSTGGQPQEDGNYSRDAKRRHLLNEQLELTNEAQRVQNDKYLTAQEKQSGVNNLVQQGRGYQRKENPASLLAKNQTQFETTSWLDKSNPNIRWVMDKDGIPRPNDISQKDGGGITGKGARDIYNDIRTAAEDKKYAELGEDFDGLVTFTEEEELAMNDQYFARMKMINDGRRQELKMTGAAGLDPLSPAVPRPNVLNQVSDGQSGLSSGQGGIEFVQDTAQQAQAGNVADDIAFVKKALETPTGTSLESIFNSPVTNQGNSSRTNDPDGRSRGSIKEKKDKKEPKKESKEFTPTEKESRELSLILGRIRLRNGSQEDVDKAIDEYIKEAEKSREEKEKNNSRVPLMEFNDDYSIPRAGNVTTPSRR